MMILMVIVCMIVLQLDDGFNNYHKYCNNLANSGDIIAKRLVMMAAIILIED